MKENKTYTNNVKENKTYTKNVKENTTYTKNMKENKTYIKSVKENTGIFMIQYILERISTVSKQYETLRFHI